MYFGNLPIPDSSELERFEHILVHVEGYKYIFFENILNPNARPRKILRHN